MVRAGVVDHPEKWKESGFSEIRNPPKRYAIIDLRELTALCGFVELEDFQRAHAGWAEEAFLGRGGRDDRWSEAIAVGSLEFVQNVRGELGGRAIHRGVEQRDGAYALREGSEAYNDDFGNESNPLRLENTVLWKKNGAVTSR